VTQRQTASRRSNQRRRTTWMASVDRRPNGQWRARWREYPGGPQKYEIFDWKVDAQRFLTRVGHDLMTGSYIDPEATRRSTFDGHSEEWAAAELGVSIADLLDLAIDMWGRSLTAEREMRALELAGRQAGGREIPSRTLQAVRGHISRHLLEELRATLERTTDGK